ncbi:unnamed protein product [Clonostachys rhizophaga]|uniref:Xylanolytic transcriptional activator regulatory domain-containing protein n=1 Tax=Clonostachys rhizophaga TaxID=160324 RepID=A0A9N9VP28_9HYPO|nr:unnamed protein product [Clonostachys rhizophaga]
MLPSQHTVTGSRSPQPPENTPVDAKIPLFCKPPGLNITALNIQKLHASDALTLPSPALQNALLEAYVGLVHPMLPILDLSNFLNAVTRGDGSAGQVSLMVYQAVMLAACPFVDSRKLEAEGFEDNRAALNVYFQRAKALYDLNYESDALAIVQTTLLMTYSFEARHNTTNSWHWSGIAISYAYNIGLHIDPETFGFEPSLRKLRRRLWWACFMQDQMVGLATRQPPRIRKDDFSTKMLQDRDFDVFTDPQGQLAAWFPCLLTAGQQQELALLCIEKTKLCVIISKIFHDHYTAQYKDKESRKSSDLRALLLYPKPAGTWKPNASVLDDELMAWNTALPQVVQQSPALNQTNKAPESFSIIDVHCYALCLIYRAVTLTLHRPEAQEASAIQDRWYPLMRTRTAAKEITRMLAELQSYGRVRSLPVVCIVAAIPAAVIHICDMKDTMPNINSSAATRYWKCVGVLEDLRTVYNAAPFAIEFLNAAYIKVTGDTLLTSKYLMLEETISDSPADYQRDLLTPVPSNLLETWYDANAGPMGSEDGDLVISVLSDGNNGELFGLSPADGSLQFPPYTG